MSKTTKCIECSIPLEEDNKYECYDESGDDAYYDEEKEGWICSSCKHL